MNSVYTREERLERLAANYLRIEKGIALPKSEVVYFVWDEKRKENVTIPYTRYGNAIRAAERILKERGAI